jgi:mannosyltransferase OCH1-like enzyme
VGIPRQIHFVWGLLGDAAQMPPAARHHLKRWGERHPAWEICVHGPAELERLAAGRPELPYRAYRLGIQRCDAVRPLLLHARGGVYCDLDVRPRRRSLTGLLGRYPRARVLLGVETRLSWWKARRAGRRHPIRQGAPEVRRRIANYFMASAPGHPFWLDVLALMRERVDLPVKEPYDVLYTTGPDVVSEVLARSGHRYPDVQVVPERVLRRFIVHQAWASWREP